MESLNHSSSNINDSTILIQLSTGFMGLTLLLGVPGNIFVVVFILCHFKKDNFTMHLMLNLAVSDTLCLMCLPGFIYNANFDWILSLALCKFMFSLVHTSVYASLWTVTLMSVQRYVVVLHRNQWAKLGRKGELGLLLSLWILAFILSIPATVKADIVGEEKYYCQRSYGSHQEKLPFLLYETLVGFVFPFSIMVSCYHRLHRKVNQSVFFNNQRLTKLVTTIIVTFLIFWIPVNVINLVKILAIALTPTNPSVSNKLNLSHNVTRSFTFFNSCVNPLLYVCASRKLFRSSEQPQGNHQMGQE